MKLLRDRKLLYGGGVYLTRVDLNLSPAWSAGIWLYLSLNQTAGLYASGEKEIEDLNIDLVLPDCALNNARTVSNEEEGDCSTGPLVLEPSSDENLLAVQGPRKNILDPDSLFQPTHQTSRGKAWEWII